MKYFLLLVLVSVVCEQTFADENSDLDALSTKAKQTTEKCAKIHEIPPEPLQSIAKFEKISDKPTKCFLACVFKEMDFMLNDNTFDKRKITTTLKPIIERLNKEHEEEVANKMNEIIEICVPLQMGSGDECAAAGRAYECVIENVQKLEVLPKNN